jgi:hypothetical protein
MLAVKYHFFTFALIFLLAAGSLAQQTTVKTMSYIVVASDAGNILAFNCSSPSPCTATLTAASTLGATFTVRLLSFGPGTVTISSSSTINGGTTLLKGNGSSISSDGTAFYAVTPKLYVDNNSKGTDVLSFTDHGISVHSSFE